MNDYPRTNQPLHISEIWPLCVQEYKKSEGSNTLAKIAKTAKIVAKTAKKPAKTLAKTSEPTHHHVEPNSYGLATFFLFLVVLVLVMMPKSFWESVWQRIKQKKAESKAVFDENTTETSEDIEPKI